MLNGMLKEPDSQKSQSQGKKYILMAHIYQQIDADMMKFATDSGKLNDLMKEKDANESALEEKMDRWVYLNDLAERIEAQKQGGK